MELFEATITEDESSPATAKFCGAATVVVNDGDAAELFYKFISASFSLCPLFCKIVLFRLVANH
jgi:hypothetical protein